MAKRSSTRLRAGMLCPASDGDKAVPHKVSYSHLTALDAKCKLVLIVTLSS